MIIFLNQSDIWQPSTAVRVVKKENLTITEITSSKENRGVSWKSHNALINALENLCVFGFRSHESLYLNSISFLLENDLLYCKDCLIRTEVLPVVRC